jgi:GNAT superfamily N-acetyltransferase
MSSSSERAASRAAAASAEGQPRVPEVLPLPEHLSSGSPLLACLRQLCLEYRDALLAAAVPIDEFQGFSSEIDALPGSYVAAQRGGIWLALLPAPSQVPGDLSVHLGCRGAFDVVGCVALRDLGAGRGEIKRLYVRPAHRGLGAALALSAAVEAFAVQQQYRELLLDSLQRLPHALALYERLGFSLCQRYNTNPMPDVVFMSKRLQHAAADAAAEEEREPPTPARE